MPLKRFPSTFIMSKFKVGDTFKHHKYSEVYKVIECHPEFVRISWNTHNTTKLNASFISALVTSYVPIHVHALTVKTCR